MVSIKISYNGREYKSVTDAFEQAMVDGLVNVIKKKIKPFTSEITQHNGRVNIDIPKNLKNAKITFENLPEELIERIKQAL